MQIIDDLKAIENQIMDEIDAAQSLADIKAVRVKYLRKKELTKALQWYAQDQILHILTTMMTKE